MSDEGTQHPQERTQGRNTRWMTATEVADATCVDRIQVIELAGEHGIEFYQGRIPLEQFLAATGLKDQRARAFDERVRRAQETKVYPREGAFGIDLSAPAGLRDNLVDGNVQLTPQGENLARSFWDWWREEGTFAAEGRSFDELSGPEKDRVRMIVVTIKNELSK